MGVLLVPHPRLAARPGGLLAATAGWFAARSGLVLGSIARQALAGLIGAVVLIDGSMPYPGALALLPAVATAAVVVGGDRRGPARWLLSLVPLRWFGRISYSLYLWHWPFLVLPVLALGRELALDERLVLAGISIAVATASWRWIEEPFRRGWSPTISRPRTVLAGVGAMALTAAIAIGIGDGVVARLDAMASETAFASEDAAYAMAPGETVETEGAASKAGATRRSWSRRPRSTARPPTRSTRPPRRQPGPTAAPPGAVPTTSPIAAARTSAPTAAPAEPAPAPRATPGPQRLPANVAPPLTKARNDRETIVRDKCSLAISGSKPPICFYGPKDATLTVALVGDSHAAHWFPALERLADERGWRLVPFTKYSCTFVDMRIYSAWLKREYTECEAWRTNVVKALRELNPDLVVVTSHRWFPTIVAGDDDATRQGEAMARLLDQLPGRIALLADTPLSRYDVPACLSRNLDDTRRCATDRAYAFGSKPRARERVAAHLTGAALVDLSDAICPGKGKCPAVVNKMIVYRDDHHLTATFAASLAPILGERLPAFGPDTP